MKILVTRASQWRLAEEPPCEGATLQTYTSFDMRNAGSVEGLVDEPARQEWFEKGANHRVVEGRITRDFEEQAWFVEVDCLFTWLKDLRESVVMNAACEGFLQAKIYDDYLE